VHEPPCPGWNDAFIGTVPFIVALSTKQMKVLPGSPDAKIDWIPADLAVNVIIAAAVHGNKFASPVASYFHVVSHDCNPVLLKEAETAWREILASRGFGAIPAVDWKATPEEFENTIHQQVKWLRRAHSVLSAVPFMPSALTGRLESPLRGIDKLLGFGKLYAPYMSSEWRFASNNTRQLMTESLIAQDRKLLHYDTSFDWFHLWGNHIDAMYKYAVNLKSPTSKL